MDDGILDKQIENARERGQWELENEPHAVKVWFDRKLRLVFVELTTGIVMGFPVHLLQGVADGTDDQIAAVKLSPQGSALCWDELDTHISVKGLVLGIYGTKKWMSELGRRGGSVKSQAKTQSSRENGKLGGRPKKKTA